MARSRPPGRRAAPQSSHRPHHRTSNCWRSAPNWRACGGARAVNGAGGGDCKTARNEVEAARAGETWSATIDAAMLLAERIAKTPAHGIDGLVVKFDAAWWYLVLDDSILDANAARWLAAFGRSLRRVGPPQLISSEVSCVRWN